jgi:hypothetical protein
VFCCLCLCFSFRLPFVPSCCSNNIQYKKSLTLPFKCLIELFIRAGLIMSIGEIIKTFVNSSVDMLIYMLLCYNSLAMLHCDYG